MFFSWFFCPWIDLSLSSQNSFLRFASCLFQSYKNLFHICLLVMVALIIFSCSCCPQSHSQLYFVRSSQYSFLRFAYRCIFQPPKTCSVFISATRLSMIFLCSSFPQTHSQSICCAFVSMFFPSFCFWMYFYHIFFPRRSLSVFAWPYYLAILFSSCVWLSGSFPSVLKITVSRFATVSSQYPFLRFASGCIFQRHKTCPMFVCSASLAAL